MAYRRRKQKYEKLENERATLRGEYESIRNVALTESMPCEVTFEDFCPIATKDCGFCGGRTPGYTFNSVMRKPSASGYKASDVVAVCWPCKRHFKDQEGDIGKVLSRIQAIAEHLQSNEVDL